MNRRSLIGAIGVVAVGLMAFSPALAADDAKSVVDAYLAAWNAHDSAKAASYFADNVVYYDASIGTPVEGKDAAKTGVIDNFITAAPDLKWEMVGAPIVQDGSVAFQWQFSGTHTGPFSDGTAATGKPFSFSGASVFEIENGMIAKQSDYYDALGFYKQLGLM